MTINDSQEFIMNSSKFTDGTSRNEAIVQKSENNMTNLVVASQNDTQSTGLNSTNVRKSPFSKTTHLNHRNKTNPNPSSNKNLPLSRYMTK